MSLKTRDNPIASPSLQSDQRTISDCPSPSAAMSMLVEMLRAVYISWTKTRASSKVASDRRRVMATATPFVGAFALTGIGGVGIARPSQRGSGGIGWHSCITWRQLLLELGTTAPSRRRRSERATT